MRKIQLPPLPLLAELLRLDLETGELYWLPRSMKYFSTKRACSTWNARFANKIAGYTDNAGYKRICISQSGVKSRNYLSHRIIFFMVYGDQPETIDHIDMNPSNNKPSNLRAATLSQNGCNKGPHKDAITGVKGVDIRHGKYRARIRKDGKQIYLGIFETIEEAREAYWKAAKEIHGNFARNYAPPAPSRS